MNQRFYFAIALLASVVCISSSIGRNDKRTGAPGDNSCNACHMGAEATGITNLLGLPSTFTGGVEYDLILTVEDENMKRAGFQIVATDGTSGDMVGEFTPGNNSRLTTGPVSGRLTHSSPLNFSSSNLAEFNFKWEAPRGNSAPSQIVFYYNIVAANANGGTSGDAVYQGTSEEMTLPIVLAGFDVYQEGNFVKLEWKVYSGASEDGRFEIERSLDAQSGQVISVVATQSNISAFDYVDSDPIYNQDVYYRLKMIDEDGLKTYSEWKSVVVTPERTLDNSLYPNPLTAGNALQIALSSDKQKTAQVAIFDLNGKAYTSQLEYDLQKGSNLIVLRDVQLDKPGMYIVRINDVESGDTLATHKLYYQGDR